MNLKEQIKNKGYRLGWIAERVGVSKSLFSMYITGTRDMPEDVKNKVKEILR